MNALFAKILHASRIGLLPVRIRHGYLRGARWTLWPHSSYWRGHYEQEVQAALFKHAPSPGSAAWDLGAHFGFYSLWLARAVGPDGEIVAVEPDPVSLSRLKRHIRLNPWVPVRAYACAASDRAGRVHLIQSEGAGATTSHLPYQGEHAASTATIEIVTVRLDDLAAREKLRPPTLIKIDVEGHAAAVLLGTSGIVSRHRPRLLISMHSPEECTGVRDVLQPLGYQPTDLVDRPVAWEQTLYNTAWFSCP